MIFDADYFERGIETKRSCYENYRWLPDLTMPFCQEVITKLGIEKNDKVLDFGCAKGFFVKGLRRLGVDAYGVDISKYAIKNADKEVKKYVKLVNGNIKGNYKWIISKDVLEHISYGEIDDVLQILYNVGQKMFFIIPLGKNKRFIIPEYESDITHSIREPLSWWKDKFIENGFSIVEVRYLIKGMKESWSHWKRGNGFFILEA
jgi:predicted TPR repeat methyltransferase